LDHSIKSHTEIISRTIKEQYRTHIDKRQRHKPKKEKEKASCWDKIPKPHQSPESKPKLNIANKSQSKYQRKQQNGKMKVNKKKKTRTQFQFQAKKNPTNKRKKKKKNSKSIQYLFSNNLLSIKRKKRETLPWWLTREVRHRSWFS
jgi:hypothetical protein